MTPPVNDVTYEFPNHAAADAFAEDLLDIHGIPTIMGWGSRLVRVAHNKPRELIDELAATRDGVEILPS